MPEKFKNFFSFFAKKKPFLLVFFFVILGIFLPIRPALAVWDWLVGAIQFIPNTTIAVLSFFVASIASLLAALSGAILNYVISPTFTTLSYTNPANNKLIEVGLGITQGFANMLLVLVLVYIAIATILRRKEYEAQKLLPIFIVVALLVNFSPVICGLIVDASNIVMNFFLSELTGGKQLINSFGAIWEGIKEGFDWKKAFTFTGQLDTIFNFLILAVVNLALFLVLLLFAVIFMYRHIAIWILVILSPLAFICYILPATRKYWTMWWNQFIQWSIIGITCGFFLYLAELLASMGTGVYGTAPKAPGTSILPHLVPLGFLIMGLVYGLKTAAMGSAATIRGFQAAHKRAQIRTLKGIGRGTIAATVGTAALIGRTARTAYRLPAGVKEKGWKGGFKEAGKEIVRPWGRRAKAAIETEKESYRAWKAGEKPGPRGFLNAIRDVAGTGWTAAMKLPKKRKLSKEEKEKIIKGEEEIEEKPEE